MHTVIALLCFVVVIHWLIFLYPSGLLHPTVAPVPAKQPWWIWMNTSCEFIMNDCITTTKQSTTKPCAYFLGYTVVQYLAYLIGILFPPHVLDLSLYYHHVNPPKLIPAQIRLNCLNLCNTGWNQLLIFLYSLQKYDYNFVVFWSTVINIRMIHITSYARGSGWGVLFLLR